MLLIFGGATEFNQDLSGWDVNNVRNCARFSDRASAWVLPKPNFENCSTDAQF